MDPTVWDIDQLLLVIHVLGVGFLLVLAFSGEVRDFQRTAFAILGELDFAVAHRLVALHVGEQQEAGTLGFVARKSSFGSPMTGYGLASNLPVHSVCDGWPAAFTPSVVTLMSLSAAEYTTVAFLPTPAGIWDLA